MKIKAKNVRSISKKKTKDNKTTTVSVREIENGWIMTESTEWKNKDGWQYETKETYYPEDPLKDIM